MCFDIGSRHLVCLGQNTSRIQNKEVYTTLYLQYIHTRQVRDRCTMADGSFLMAVFPSSPSTANSHEGTSPHTGPSNHSTQPLFYEIRKEITTEPTDGDVTGDASDQRGRAPSAVAMVATQAVHLSATSPKDVVRTATLLADIPHFIHTFPLIECIFASHACSYIQIPIRQSL